MSSMSLSTAIVSWQLGRINRRLSLPTLIKLSFAIYALSLALIPLMPSLWLVLIPTIIFGIGNGIGMPSIQTSIAGLAPLDYRAAFMSLNATMLRLGQTVGPPLMGLIYIYGGLDITFFIAAALALTVPTVAIVFSRKNQAKEGIKAAKPL